MKFILIFYIFLFFISLTVCGHISISGKILDIETNNPVEYVTVYINGTTKGTITDSTGYFHLEKVITPCALVLSHVGYKTFSTNLENRTYSGVEFLLTPKDVFLNEICISDQNLRKNNLELFRSDFLGTDVWGKYAKIENEDALYFSKEYFQKQCEVSDKQLPYFLTNNLEAIQWSEDSTFIIYPKLSYFKVNAKEPLIVDLPLLGYKVYIDLIGFVHEYLNRTSPDKCAYLGLFYFQPIKFITKRDSIRITKNRVKVYYNSAQHFCRSLYDNKLLENGYLLYEHFNIDSLKKNLVKKVDVDSLLLKGNNLARVISKKDVRFGISYYENYRGKPVNLRNRKGYEPSVSTMILLNDTCFIRKNGTVPGTDILFGGSLGVKKVGAMLPDDYKIIP